MTPFEISPASPSFDQAALWQDVIAKAYLHPSMAAVVVGEAGDLLAESLAPLVRQLQILDVPPGEAFPAASVEAIFAAGYLFQSPDPQASLQRIVSALLPGGRLVILDVQPGFERLQIRDWLEQVGLVNVVVDGAGGSAPQGAFIAAGTRRMEVHDTVQASYAAQAQGAGCGCNDLSCCSPDVVLPAEIGAVSWDGGYSLDEKAGVPEEAALISLGCGNPLAMAGLRAGEKVLDIGSGGGIDVFLAAKRVGPQGFVTGVDMTPAMLQRARRAAEKGGYTNVRFRHGYAEKLPVDDASMDVVISNCVINLTEDKGRVFREIFRVLRDGGRLEVNDMVFGGPVPLSLRTSRAGWSECISGALPEQEYVDLVRQAGFREVSVQRSTSHGASNGVPVYSVQVSAQK